MIIFWPQTVSAGSCPVSVDPGVDNVLLGVDYVIDDVDLTGTYQQAGDYPDAADVRAGVVYDFGTKTGTIVIPDASTVEIATVFDNGTTGTYTGANRWSDPGESNVLLGVEYLANAIQKEGTLAIPNPPAPGLCNVYGYLKNLSGEAVAGAMVTFSLYSDNKSLTEAGGAVLTSVVSVISDVNGLFQKDLIKSSEFENIDLFYRVEITTADATISKSISGRALTFKVPDEENVDITSLLPVS